MIVLKFREKEDHQEILKTVKKMKKELEEVEDCLETATEETEYRGGSYRRERYDDDDWRERSRYGYSRR